jgi:hypothetical protein
MVQETVTQEERMRAAIELDKPDRVPIAPWTCTPAAARLLDFDASEIVAEGGKMKRFHDLGDSSRILEAAHEAVAASDYTEDEVSAVLSILF